MSTPSTELIASDANSKEFCEHIIKLLNSEDGLARCTLIVSHPISRRMTYL